MIEEKKLHDSSMLGERPSESNAGLVWLCIGIASLWLLCTVAIYWLFPDWQTRGTAGDSFGAVNALFSGLAFVGVIYALLLQRKELTYQREELLATRKVSEAQLAEMRTSRELLAQPLPIPDVEILKVERPRFFYSPPEQEHNAQSRYTVAPTFSNPTQYPATRVNVRCFVQFGEPRKILGATDIFMPIVAAGANIDDPKTRPDFLFAGDTSGLLYDSLRQRDPRKVPVILVMVLFKNVIGAHFQLAQAFRIYTNEEQSEQLRIWHTGIAGFQAKYKHELAHLQDLKRKGREEEWSEVFQRVKNEFAESVPGEDAMFIRAIAVPASFSVEHITSDKYEKEMEAASYSQFIGSVYNCPAELDIRQ